MANHNDFGKQGEKLAADYLLRNKYILLEKNFRYRKAEIDLIAIKGNELIIVEVKARSSDYFGNPQDFISPKKIELLTEAANYYVINNDLDVNVRFDIISVLKKSGKTELKHFENAFLHF